MAVNYEPLKKDLIAEFEDLYKNLVTIYANEFVNLTEHELDSKYNMIGNVNNVLVLITIYMMDRKVDPTNPGNIPDWLNEFGAEMRK